MRYLLMATVALSLSSHAQANNAACWGYDGKNDTERSDISCTPITEPMLIRARLMTKASVIKMMNAPGRLLPNGTLRYLTNPHHGGAGSGNVNFTFNAEGLVSIVNANVDTSDNKGHFIEYIWNAELGGCSDFPKSRNRCSDE